VRAVSGIAADADTVLVFVAGQLANGSADVTLAMPHGRLRDDIHARSAGPNVLRSVGLQRDRPAVQPEPRRDLTAAPVRVARVS
jgi:hypothetical protein